MKTLFLAFTLAAVSLTSQVATASTFCEADRLKFCPGIEAGDGRIRECMEAHKAELSAQCRNYRETIKEERSEMREACKGPIEEFCSKEDRKDDVGIRMCLTKRKQIYKTNYSAACQNQLKDVNQLRRSGMPPKGPKSKAVPAKATPAM